MFSKLSPQSIGFLQACGLTLYILFIATVMNFISGKDFLPDTFLAPAIFLMLFVISALISASLVFGYPVVLFFNGRKEAAIKIVLWTGICMVVFLLVLILLSLIFLSKK